MSEIDVSMCEFCNTEDFEKPICRQLKYRNEVANLCEYKDCYYKQLQQLKAENESLQSLNDFYVQKFETLEAENEELKNQIKGEINATQKWYQKHTNEKFKADKYKNALDDIKEICNDSNCDNTICEKCRFNSIDCDFDRRNAVIQKSKR